MKHRVKTGVVAAMIVPGLVACGSASVETSEAPTTLWNPCTEISDDVLRSVGVVPATEDSGIVRPLQSRQEICRWDAPEYAYTVTVFSKAETVAEFEHQRGYTNFRDTTLAGRAGRQFKVAGASKHLGCNVAFAAEQGSFQIRIFIDPVFADREDPCRRLDLVGQSMVPVLPR